MLPEKEFYFSRLFYFGDIFYNEEWGNISSIWRGLIKVAKATKMNKNMANLKTEHLD